MSSGKSEPRNQTDYTVVVNHEGQYSLWPSHKDLPLGWKAVAHTGTKEDCLTYIRQVWTDMKPLSIRKELEGA